MIVTISGSPRQIKILPDFAPTTDIAVKWGIATNGRHYLCGRSSSSDVHSCAIRVMGDYDDISAIYSALTTQGQTRILQTVLEAGEYLWGPMTVIDGNAVYIAFTDIGSFEQRTLSTAGFSATVVICDSITPDATPALPALFRPVASHRIELRNYAEFAIMYNLHTGGVEEVQNNALDSVYSFSCIMPHDEAAAFQAWYETENRGSTVQNTGPDVNLSGVSDPFGYYAEWPCAVNFLQVSYSPMGPKYWRVSCTLARAK